MLPVWPYLWILKFWNFLSLGVIYLIGGQLATSRQSLVVVYIYEQRSNHPIIIYLIRCISLAFSPHFLSLHRYIYIFLYSSGSITSAAAAVLHETSDCNQGLVGMYKSSIVEDPKPLTPQSSCYNQVGITLYFLIHLPWTATDDVLIVINTTNPTILYSIFNLLLKVSQTTNSDLLCPVNTLVQYSMALVRWRFWTGYSHV